MILAWLVLGLGAATWLLGRPGRPRPAVGRHEGARVSVVIPARNEAAALPALLESLERLDPPAHEVIVVDDESGDSTREVARARGARVVSSALPPGWLGKPWACHTGAAAASGTHLLFLDADTRLAPAALGALIVEHGRRGGLLSVQPYHVPGAPHEDLSAYCNAVAMMGSGGFAFVRPAVAAFGPCMLTTAVDYHRTGGHRSVRHEVIEDLRLAQRYADSGLDVTCLAGGDLVRYRMYPDGWRQLADGWTKNLAAGAGAASLPAVAGTVVWVASHVAVATMSVAAVLRAVSGAGPVPIIPVAAWVAVALHQRWLLGRIGSFRPWTAIAFPLPLAAFVAIFVRSAVVTAAGGVVDWRGRPVALRADRRR